MGAFYSQSCNLYMLTFPGTAFFEEQKAPCGKLDMDPQKQQMSVDFSVFFRILLIEDFEHLEIKDLLMFLAVYKPSQMSENFLAFTIAVHYFVFLFIDN